MRRWLRSRGPASCGFGCTIMTERIGKNTIMDENLLHSSTRPLPCRVSLCFRLFPERVLPPFSPWIQAPSTLSSIPSQEVIIFFLEKGPCPTVPKLEGCSLRHTCLAKVLSGRDQCESETNEFFPSVLGGLGPLDFSMTLRRVDLTTK